ncbi:MAG: response regulator [Desulfovibrionales bacterium]|nr:response regulator [Desulfovibrionales bacterium]
MAAEFQVLIVDDEPVLREICQEALSEEGYAVEIASNGQDALDRISGRGQAFDLIISDLRMPDMNGQELLDKVRQRNLDVDFLVMTGYGTTETAVDFMKSGAADYIAKPFDLKHMLHRVRSILAQRKARREQEKLSAVVRMLNLSKSLGAQLNHVAVVDEFLAHLRESFSPAAVCLLLPDLLDQGPILTQGDLLDSNEGMRLFVTRLCERIMEHGRSYLLDQFTLQQSSFSSAFFPHGFPYSVMAVPLDLSQKRIGVVALVRNEQESLYKEQDLQLLVVFASHTASALRNAHLYSRLQILNQDVIRSFAQAVEVKDFYTRGHSERVAEYACRLGRAVGIGGKELERLHIAGMLHDIGKIGIPDHILNKPGMLSSEEYAIMKRHSIMGRDILGQVGALCDITPIIYSHHECVDGSGYPEGLSGDEIPPLARIICLADSYEAMSSNRAYRQALPLEKVLYTLDRGAGSQWDEELTRTWIDIIEREHPGYPGH